MTGEKEKLQQENGRLHDENDALAKENAILKDQSRDYRRLKKHYGPKLEKMLNQLKVPRQRGYQEKQVHIA